MDERINFYQARNGGIYLNRHKKKSGYTSLTLKQIIDLKLDVTKLEDFLKEDYKKFYDKD